MEDVFLAIMVHIWRSAGENEAIGMYYEAIRKLNRLGKAQTANVNCVV